MHVVLINQFYPPAQAPTGGLLQDLARVMCDAGHAVTVITSAAPYGGLSSETAPDLSGVTVLRVGPKRAHGSGLLSKFLDYARFFPHVSAALASLTPPPNAVVCMTTPPFIGVIARRLLRRKGIPYFLWCMDLYPEALSASGMLHPRNPLYRILSRLAGVERGDATGVISLGADMTRRLRESVPAATVLELPVWSQVEPTSEDLVRARELRRQRGWRDDEVILLYSGNIGRAHRVDEFVALAEAVREGSAPMRMVFSGTGPQRAVWQQRLGDRATWCDPVAPAAVAAHLLAADVHLISQAPAWTGVVVPSKYQAACALGRPVVFAGHRESAVAQWIEQDDCGWVLSSAGDPSRFSELLGELGDAAVRQHKGMQARRQSAALFHAEILTQRLRAWIENASMPR